jgi:hypothetical protein
MIGPCDDAMAFKSKDRETIGHSVRRIRDKLSVQGFVGGEMLLFSHFSSLATITETCLYNLSLSIVPLANMISKYLFI